VPPIAIIIVYALHIDRGFADEQTLIQRDADHSIAEVERLRQADGQAPGVPQMSQVEVVVEVSWK
jgi:hypothetical protein